jgi:signal transduction histidine kinase
MAASDRARWLDKVGSRAAFAEGNQRSQPSRSMARIFAGGNSARSLAGLIHDARNMVSAMDLYRDLLAEPGVLSPAFGHYAGELRLVSGAGRRLLEELAITESELAITESMIDRQSDAPLPIAKNSWVRTYPDSIAVSELGVSKLAVSGERNGSSVSSSVSSSLSRTGAPESPAPPELALSDSIPSRSLAREGLRKAVLMDQTIASLAEKLSANRSLLAALAGHAVTVGLTISGGQRPIAMNADDLTRVLVNLTRNAADAMPCGGDLQIALEEGVEYLSLTFTDNGPGIPEGLLEAIFTPGFSTHSGTHEQPASEYPDTSAAVSTAWPVRHRGLGLSIVRSIVTAAGGSIWAANRSSAPGYNPPAPESAEGQSGSTGASPPRGAIIVMEFPLLEPHVAT